MSTMKNEVEAVPEGSQNDPDAAKGSRLVQQLQSRSTRAEQSVPKRRPLRAATTAELPRRGGHGRAGGVNASHVPNWLAAIMAVRTGSTDSGLATPRRSRGRRPYPQVPKLKRNSLPLGLMCSTPLTLSTVPPPRLTIWNLSVEVPWEPPVVALEVSPNQMVPASE